MYHMNHAKYLRAFEYGRAVFVGDTGLLQGMLDSAKQGKFYVVSAIAIRYRRQVRCFERYRILTKVSVGLAERKTKTIRVLLLACEVWPV